MVGITIIAMLLGAWARFVRKVVTIQPAQQGSRLEDEYVGFDHSGAKIRNIAVAKFASQARKVALRRTVCRAARRSLRNQWFEH